MGKPIKKTDRNKDWNRKVKKKRFFDASKSRKEKTYLIICEGVNTEPNYFESFRVHTINICLLYTSPSPRD